MSRRFDLIVFDWDGTLMDSAAAIVSAIGNACDDLGVPRPPEARARHVIGLGLGDALRTAVPELDSARYGEMVSAYRRHYLAGDADLSLFQGVPKLLESLLELGATLAVATGKSRVGLDRALNHTGTRSYFAATRCADECFSKPHPQMLLELMDELATKPERTLMIGDTTHDLQMARAARVAALAVAYGAHPRSDLVNAEPLATLETPEELAAWLITNG